MMRETLREIFCHAHAAAFAALLLAAALAPHARAQTAQPRPRDNRAATPSTANAPAAPSQTRAGETAAEPDLSITARVTADSLRFEKVPNPKVEFTGKPRRETVWESERENLPQEVRPGVTYRNIGITLRITSVFADIDRIVAEALGEVPLSDDAQPQATPPAQPTAPPDARTPAASETLESRTAQTPSPAKASTRANARGRAARRGRGR